jgi:hypothetical protein
MFAANQLRAIIRWVTGMPASGARAVDCNGIAHIVFLDQRAKNRLCRRGAANITKAYK